MRSQADPARQGSSRRAGVEKFEMTTAVAREPERREPRATRARASASQLLGRRILYVDDDSFLRNASSRLLAGAGAICLLAGTHERALAIVDDEPDLALAILDFHMPDGDVGSLVERLRIARARLPLIGTSGADRRHDFADRGVTAFLEKPWQLVTLVRALDW